METITSINHYFQQRNEAMPAPRALLHLIETLPIDEGILLCLSKDDDALLITRYLQRFGLSVGKLSDGEFDITLLDLEGESKPVERSRTLVFCGCPESGQSYAKAMKFLSVSAQPASVNSLIPAKDISILNALLKENGHQATAIDAIDEGTALGFLSKRLSAKLTRDASAVEYSQYLDVGQHMLQAENAGHIMAFLLRNYLNQTAPAIVRPIDPRRELRERGRERGGHRADRSNGREGPRERRDFREARNSDAPEHQQKDVKRSDSQDAAQALIQPEIKKHRESDESRENGRPLDPQKRNGDMRMHRAPEAESLAPGADDQAQSLYINLGRDDGFNSLQDLIDYLSGHSRVDIGHFTMVGHIRDHSSHVEVDKEVSPRIIEAFHGKTKTTGKKTILNDGQEAFPAFVCEVAKGTRERRPHSRFHRPRHQPRII
jgi:hypothetical protein